MNTNFVPSSTPEATPTVDPPAARRWIICAKCGVPLGIKGLSPGRATGLGIYLHDGPCPGPGLISLLRARYGLTD